MQSPRYLKTEACSSFVFSDANAPFAQWSTERVCTWLQDFGLAQYVIFARQWVTSGHTLLTATPQDMEKVRAECEEQMTRFFPQNSAWIGGSLHLSHILGECTGKAEIAFCYCLLL